MNYRDKQMFKSKKFKYIPLEDIYSLSKENLSLLNPVMRWQFRCLKNDWTKKSKEIAIENYWYVLTSDISYVKYLKYQFLKDLNLAYFQYNYFSKIMWVSMIIFFIIIFGPVLFATLTPSGSSMHLITVITAILAALPIASVSFGIGAFLSLFQKRREMKIKFKKYIELVFIFNIKKDYSKEIADSEDYSVFLNKIDLTKTFNAIDEFFNFIDSYSKKKIRKTKDEKN